jgi:hypothetical protein
LAALSLRLSIARLSTLVSGLGFVEKESREAERSRQRRGMRVASLVVRRIIYVNLIEYKYNG